MLLTPICRDHRSRGPEVWVKSTSAWIYLRQLEALINRHLLSTSFHSADDGLDLFYKGNISLGAEKDV